MEWSKGQFERKTDKKWMTTRDKRAAKGREKGVNERKRESGRE